MSPQADDPQRPGPEDLPAGDPLDDSLAGARIEPLPFGRAAGATSDYAPDRRTPFVPLRTETPAPLRRLHERPHAATDWRAWGAAVVGAVLALAAFAGILAWALALRG